ncbi:MAG: hypothetical protein ACOY90_20820 [Candidatus Zhuqueibacterota bacterium]
MYNFQSIKQIRCKSILFILISIVLYTLELQAQSVVQIIPPIQETKTFRGQQGKFTFTVVNVGDNIAPAKFAVYNMDLTPDGKPFIADSSYTRGCGSWIKISPRDTIINAHETIELCGTIDVPRDAEGGYYALIEGSFEGIDIPFQSEKVDLKGSAIALKSKARVVLLLTVPSSRNKPIITPDTLFVFPKGQKNADTSVPIFNPNAKNGWEVIMPVSNKGNIHTKVTGRVSFWSEIGTHIESSPMLAGKGYLLPGKVRNFYAEGQNALSDGYYLMRISLQIPECPGMSKNFPFAVYQGKAYPGALSDDLEKLIRASSPGFLIRHPFLQKSITPGGKTYIAIQIQNTSKDTLYLHPRKMEWNLDSYSQPILSSDKKIQKRSCVDWITLSDQNVEIYPGKSQALKLNIISPEKIDGAFYGAIIFDQENIPKNLPTEFLASRTQLLALSTKQDLKYDIEVDTILVRKESNQSAALHIFEFTARNMGNIHSYASGNIILEKELAPGVFDRVDQAKEFGDKFSYLLPNNDRKFQVAFPNLKPGKYRIILSIYYHENLKPNMTYQLVSIK